MPNQSQSSRSRGPQGKGLPQLNPQAAGIDVGATEIFASVPSNCDPQPIRSFCSFTRDLHALAQWLMQCGITTVAMESTKNR